MRPVRLPPPPEATTASGSALLLALSLSHWLSLTPAGTPFAAPCSRRPPRPRSVRRPVRPPFFLISAARLGVLCGTPSSPEPARPTAETVRHGDGERCRPWRSCRGPLARLLSVARPASGERSAAACSLSCSLSSLSARLDAQHASCRAARARPREPRCRPRPDVDHLGQLVRLARHHHHRRRHRRVDLGSGLEHCVEHERRHPEADSQPHDRREPGLAPVAAGQRAYHVREGHLCVRPLSSLTISQSES